MAEKQEKYVILKADEVHYLRAHNDDFADAWETVEDQIKALREHKGKSDIGRNEYIICNRDEPYAEEVWQTILRGEDAKMRDPQR